MCTQRPFTSQVISKIYFLTFAGYIEKLPEITLNLLNVNIRSLSKNFDSLKECLKSLDCEFALIGVSESHLKDKPNEVYNIPGFNVEYTNRNGREKGRV